MVNIDTVYQRVLALANKEQRGYVTPQEFNLFANQAQVDIFEQYFYDLNQFGRIPGNDTEYANMISVIKEKIQLFEKQGDLPFIASVDGYSLAPLAPHKLGSVGVLGKLAEEIDSKDIYYILNSKITSPTKTRPGFVRKRDILTMYPATIISPITVNYISKPINVSWGYVVINDQALYNANTSVNFELHPSEEAELVIKILSLAGIEMEDSALYQVAEAEDARDIQQEKQ
tara:strand:+ start:1462 stop:2151 length:690 start_codon:yes stop_codon:yes gene_type:complete